MNRTMIAVAALVVLAASASAIAQNAPSSDTPSVRVTLQAVHLSTLRQQLPAYGDVLPSTTHTISSAIPGQLVQLNVLPGQAVRRGQVLARLAPDPLAQQARAQADSALHLARSERVRVQEMRALQLATQSQLDTAIRAEQDAASAVSAQQALAQTVLRADADGVVLAVTAAQGDRIAAGAPLMQLGATDGLKVVLGIEPDDLLSLRVGLPVTLAPLGQPQTVIQAGVTQLQPMVDARTQLAGVLVRLPGNSGLLPGMRVQANIALAPRQAYEVPRQAVLAQGDGHYVFQVRAHTARRVKVQQVVDNGATLGVVGAIDPALPLVVQGNYELADGMAVREGQ